MEFDRRNKHGSTSEASREHTSTPGKTTLTERLPPAGQPSVAGSTRKDAVGTTTHASPVPISSGPRPSLQMLFRNRSAASPEQVHAATTRGTATAATQLPHIEQIQRSFGRHDVSGVQAHAGPDAVASSQEMGATAYATGNHVVLGAGTNLHTVAHEAAHVIQQRAGVHLAGGVGAAGDAYEQHADAVADKVVHGESAEALLDQHAKGSTNGSAIHPRRGDVQRAEHAAPTPRVAEVPQHQLNAALKVVIYDAAGQLAAVWSARAVWEGRLPQHYHGNHSAGHWTWSNEDARSVRIQTHRDGSGGISIEAWATQHHGVRVEIYADPIDAVTARHDGAEPDAHAPGHAERPRNVGDGSTERLAPNMHGHGHTENTGAAARSSAADDAPGRLGEPAQDGAGTELDAVSDPEGERLAEEFEHALLADLAERGDDEEHERPGAGYTGGHPTGRTGPDTSTRGKGPGGATARDGGQNEASESTRGPTDGNKYGDRYSTGPGVAQGRYGGEGGPESAGVRGAGAFLGGVIAVPTAIRSAVEIALLLDAGDITGAGGKLFGTGIAQGLKIAAARQLVAREARAAASREIQQLARRPEWRRTIAGLTKEQREQALLATSWELQRRFFRGYLGAAKQEQAAVHAALAKASPNELAALEARRAAADAGEELATVEPVAGRLPRNHEFAGKEFPREQLPAAYREQGLRFKATGHPDFEPYALELPNGHKTVRIELTGNRTADMAAARKAAGLKKDPRGYTWHHGETEGEMSLVPTDLHDTVKHSGGIASRKHRTGASSYD